MSTSSLRRVVILLLALASASVAHANMRGPRVDPHNGSSALYAATAVQVLREALDFDCRLKSCEIVARYTLCKQGSFTYEQRYEIWPLKEWSLAPDFQLTLRVRYTREKKPRLWQRWFGGVYTLRCLDERDVRIGPELARDLQHVSFERVFAASELPDRLICELGSEHLLREARPEPSHQGAR